jgi:hypothetical protein
MALPNESMVLDLLKPYFPALAAGVQSAWNDWLGSTEFSRTRYPRTRANIVWEGMQRHARVNLAPHSAIRAIEREQSVAFLVADQVLIRFKKGDAHGLSRNISTRLALKYHDPRQASLIGEVCRVEVVYQLNVLNTQVADILIVARNRDVVVWSSSIMPIGDVIQLPVPQAAPAGSPADDVLTAKKPETPDTDTSTGES